MRCCAGPSFEELATPLLPKLRATNTVIAQALQLPVGTVMSRLHRARAFLRHELATPQ